MPAVLVSLVFVGYVKVIGGKVVGLLKVACHHRRIIPLVIDGCSDIGHEAPVSPLLVDVQHHISVERPVGAILKIIASVASAECGECGGIVFAGLFVCGLVESCAACYIHPVSDVPLEGSVEHVAALVHVPVVAVLHPVRVLDVVSSVPVRPVLGHHSADRIPAFIVLHFREIVSAREEIQTCDRVVICTLGNEVVVPLDDEAGPEVKDELVVGELGGVARSEVVPVILALRNNTGGIGGRG